MSDSPANSAHLDRNRKRKALLAGGLVLGLGATATLAAWTDDVWVNGTFTAGKFNVQGAVTATSGNWATASNWQELNTSGTAGTLAFTVNPAAMTPGDAVYAPLNLRVDPSKNSYNAAITLPTAPTGPASATPAENQAFFNALRVTLYNVAPGSCSSAGIGATAGITGLTNVALTTTATTPIAALELNKDSTAKGVCFKVELPADSNANVQGGTTGTLTWNFRATSA
ncbi:MAG: SipW-dependent-type signal peptide-containing protein [Dietzia sp.]